MKEQWMRVSGRMLEIFGPHTLSFEVVSFAQNQRIFEVCFVFWLRAVAASNPNFRFNANFKWKTKLETQHERHHNCLLRS